MTRPFLGFALTAAMSACLVGCSEKATSGSKETKTTVSAKETSAGKGNGKEKEIINVPFTTDSTEQIKEKLQKNEAVLVDVREQDEWDKGHLEGAILYSVNAIREDAKNKRLKAELPKDKPIYLHCKAGKRATTAANILQARGYDVRPLNLGYDELVKKGMKPATQIPAKTETDKTNPASEEQKSGDNQAGKSEEKGENAPPK